MVRLLAPAWPAAGSSTSGGRRTSRSHRDIFHEEDLLVEISDFMPHSEDEHACVVHEMLTLVIPSGELELGDPSGELKPGEGET
mmetsp:Transcript_29518/g.87599  ORF Transcript_29518/g.87599 Transcript_29518/m.87599 type:complete len:84 (-) Transcript_29518:1098-1349(-)